MTASPVLLSEHVGLVDTVDHLLNRGVVLTGEATVSVAGVDLVYLGLKVLLTSVENVGSRQSAVGSRQLAVGSRQQPITRRRRPLTSLHWAIGSR